MCHPQLLVQNTINFGYNLFFFATGVPSPSLYDRECFPSMELLLEWPASVLHVFWCGSCSASCAYPTMGDLRALATAAHEGWGLPFLNQSLIMAVRHLPGFWLVTSMESSVPTEIPSLRPMLYHSDLATHTPSRTSPRSSGVSSAVKINHKSLVI